MAESKFLNTPIAQSEKLDNLNLSGKDLHQALNSLAWVNNWFGNHRIIIKSVLQIIKKYPEKKHFKIIDLGCGGGDVILKLAKTLQRKNIRFSIIGIDGNENSLNFAKARTKSFSQISYQKADILNSNFQIESCDILISSHFIYHFESAGLIHFLKQNLSNVHIAFINSGLERNSLAYWLFKNFAFLLPISRLAKEDGLLAIQRAFSKKELEGVLKAIPNLGFEVKRVPFFRLKTLVHCFISFGMIL